MISIRFYGNFLFNYSDGSFKSIILGLVKNNRDLSLIKLNSETNKNFLKDVLTDVVSLKTAGETRNESIFVNIFTIRPFSHILAVQYQFSYIYSKSLISILKSQFPNDSFQVYKYLLQSIEYHHRFLAIQFHTALNSFFTDYSTLTRLIVKNRAKTLMRHIKEEYSLNFKRSLLEDCERKTHGDYGKLISALI
jgi:hypothetical protein